MTAAEQVAQARARLFAALPEARDRGGLAQLMEQQRLARFSAPTALSCGLTVRIQAAGDGNLAADVVAADASLHLATGIATEVGGVRRSNWHLYPFVLGDANYQRNVAAVEVRAVRMIAALESRFPAGSGSASDRVADAVAAWLGSSAGARVAYRSRMAYRYHEAIGAIIFVLEGLDTAEQEPRTNRGRTALARTTGPALEARIADFAAARQAIRVDREDPMAIAVAHRSPWRTLTGLPQLRNNSPEYWDRYFSAKF